MIDSNIQYEEIVAANTVEGSENEQSAHYRVLPHNIEAEQGLLGALLVDNRAYEKIGDFLKAEHFSVAAHQRIYEAAITLIERGQSVSPVTLKGYFEKDDELKAVGGASYLAEVAASVVTVVNAKAYAQTIYELHLRRQLIALGEELVNDAYEQSIDQDAVQTIEKAEGRLFGLAETGDIRGGFITLKDSVAAAIEIAEKAFHTEGNVTGATTGLRDLDHQLGGLHESDLIILAGRPSMGKSALAMNISFNTAKTYANTGGKEGAIVGFFSLEMSSDQLATRILADESGIGGDDIRKGNIKEDDFRKFVEASQVLSQVPLYIDDTPALSISALRTRARRLKRQHGLGLLVVDYLQLLRGNGSKRGQENRVQEVSEITQGLKAIAKELDIPVLALSQLSRAVEQREDKRPQLSDLRESGSIEQDADIVMFVYRAEYYLEREKPEEGDSEKMMLWQEKIEAARCLGECIVAKQRHGPVGTVVMHFDGPKTKFSDFDHSRYDQH